MFNLVMKFVNNRFCKQKKRSLHSCCNHAEHVFSYPEVYKPRAYFSVSVWHNTHHFTA